MRPRDPFDVVSSRPSKAKSEPFPFVLDELSPLDPFTRPMFGCLAVYVGERIVLILRDKGPDDQDNGVWLAFEPDQLAPLLAEFPGLQPIQVFGDKVSGWKKLSSRSADFEEAVLRACSLILRGDPRIGKVPGAKRKSPKPATAKTPAAKPKAASKSKAGSKAKPPR